MWNFTGMRIHIITYLVPGKNKYKDGRRPGVPLAFVIDRGERPLPHATPSSGGVGPLRCRIPLTIAAASIRLYRAYRRTIQRLPLTPPATKKHFKTLREVFELYRNEADPGRIRRLIEGAEKDLLALAPLTTLNDREKRLLDLREPYREPLIDTASDPVDGGATR
jgi:hypothetical protein